MTRLENTGNINTALDNDNEINNMTPYFKNIMEGMSFESYNHNISTSPQGNSFIEIFDKNSEMIEQNKLCADLDAHVNNSADQSHQDQHHFAGIDVVDYGKTTRTNTLIDDAGRMEDYEQDELPVMQAIDGVSQKTVWANFQTGRTMLSYSQPLKYHDHQNCQRQAYHPVKGKFNQPSSGTHYYTNNNINNNNQHWSNYMNSPQASSAMLGQPVQQQQQQVYPGMAHLQHRFSHPSISSGSTAQTYYYPQSGELDLQAGRENRNNLINQLGYAEEWDTHTNTSDYRLAAQCFQTSSTRSNSTSNNHQAGETQSVSLVSSHSGSDNSRELLVSTTDLCIFDTNSGANSKAQTEEPATMKPSPFQYVTFTSPTHSTKKSSSKYRRGNLSATSHNVKMVTMPSVHIGQDVLLTPVLDTPPNSTQSTHCASSNLMHVAMEDSSASASGVWSKDVCDAFFQSLAIIPKDDSSRIKLNKKMYGRNELISMYIEYKTYKKRQVKQVSSHLQVTKRRILKKLEMMTGNKNKSNTLNSASTSNSPSPKTVMGAGFANAITHSPTSGRSSSTSSMGSSLDGISKEYVNVVKNLNSSANINHNHANNAHSKRENHARAVHLKTLKLIDKGIEKTEKNMIFFRKIFEPIARELELRHEDHDSRDNTLIHHPVELEFEHIA
ncbi:hypothetical protein ACO0QE_002870 [Hanseniaspora vineae]